MADFSREYAFAAAIGGTGSEVRFERSLDGLALGPGDRLIALGDGEVRTFEPSGKLAGRWKAPQGASAVAAGPDGRVWIGRTGRLESFDASGAPLGGFDAGEGNRPAAITSLRVLADGVLSGCVLAGDATARFIRRFDLAGKPLGTIGTRNKTGCLILPNKSLVFDVTGDGAVVAGDTGRHLVTLWSLDGEPRGSFGKFGLREPADFAGCCNPVSVAWTPDGKVVTAEKAVARVKVYEPDGRLLALIPREEFDQKSTSIRLAVDSKGRILAAESARREIRIFVPAASKHEEPRSA
jgi:hypothetical protein